MGCNCGGANRSASTWVYTSPNGGQFTFRSQVEARAKQIRDEREGHRGGTIVAVSR